MTETKIVYPIGNYSILLLEESQHSPNLACAALLLLLVLTLTLNSFVLLSVLFGPLRSSPFNASLACLAASAVLDGMFNVTSSIVFHASWMELPQYYGESGARKLCRANAAVLQITGMTQSFVLAVLMYERGSLLTFRERRSEDLAETVRYDERHRIRLKWAMLLLLFFAVVMAQPIGFGVIPSAMFEHRMSCSPAYVTDRPATVLLSVASAAAFLVAWFSSLRSALAIVRKVLNERKRLADLDLVARQRAAERRSPPARASISDWAHIWGPGRELPLHILAGLLLAAFFVAVVPNIIAVQVTQFYANYDDQLEFYFPNRTLPPFDLRQIRTDIFDSIFAWTRHGYSVFSPSLILLLHGEMRNQCRITFCCCWIDKIAVPAGPPGLHLRTVRDDGPEPQFHLAFCDLTLDEPTLVRERSQPAERPFRIGRGNETIAPPRHRTKLNETFVVGQSDRENRLTETYIKIPNECDTSNGSRSRRNTIELSLVSPNGNSLLTLSQRMRLRDS